MLLSVNQIDCGFLSTMSLIAIPSFLFSTTSVPLTIGFTVKPVNKDKININRVNSFLYFKTPSKNVKKSRKADSNI